MVASAAKSATWALTLPLFSPIDEAHHYDYVLRLATERHIPEVGKDSLQTPVLAVIRNSRWFNDNAPLRGDPMGAGRVPLTPEAFEKAFTSEDFVGFIASNYEGAQPPVFYALMAPFYLLAPTREGPERVTFVRLANALLSATVVVFAYHLVMALFPSATMEALLAAGLIGGVQSFNASAGTVSNDGLSMTVSTAALLVIAKAWTAPRASPTRWLLAGTVVGFAFATKATLLFLAVCLALAVIDACRRDGRTLGSLAAAGLGALLPVAPWLAYNVRTYGDLTSSRILARYAQQLQRLTPALTPAGIWRQIAAMGSGMWSTPLHFTPLPAPYDIVAWLLLSAVVASSWRARRRDPSELKPLLGLLITAGVFLPVQLAVIYAIGGTSWLEGRHALGALPPLVISGVLAARRAIPSRLRATSGAVGVTALLIADAAGFVRNLTAFYAHALPAH